MQIISSWSLEKDFCQQVPNGLWKIPIQGVHDKETRRPAHLIDTKNHCGTQGLGGKRIWAGQDSLQGQQSIDILPLDMLLLDCPRKYECVQSAGSASDGGIQSFVITKV